ncbi:MAG: PD-(D/E)XK nuclease family protein [Firmicutes bacterium]|jgi:hypothetical protein|nr:PD-(D/E)XK nuclease family protein [Bacillota bacterium]
MSWTYSFTQFDKFESCPRSYYESYVVGAPDMQTQELELGRLSHEAVQSVVLGLLPVAEVRDWVVSRLPETLWLTEQDADTIADWAQRFCSCFRPDGSIECEKEVKIEADGVAVQVKVDMLQQVGNRIIIYDLKTNKDAYDPGETMQLPLSSWVVAEKYGVGQVECRLWFLRYREKPLRAALFGSPQMEKAKNWAISTARAIEQAKTLPGSAGFPERPGTACRACGVPLNCVGVFPPLTKEMRLDDIGADQIAGHALRLEAALAFAKKYLQHYIEANKLSSVASNGEHWGNFPKPKYLLTPERLREFGEMVLAQGKDLSQFLEINPWTVLKKDNEHIKAWLEAHAEKSTVTYFGHRAKAPEAA